ncbi:MAG: Rieske 2Fe-2S domain-containing protein [Proteobacteria bacterium]|nr:Rieske 2Fe-2S domain-containing protein [Pseudomonadota bacterium]
MTHILCKTSDIKDPGSKSFQLKIRRKTRDIFVVHKDGQVFAYYNQCPHTGINLEWQEDQFLDLDNALIQCASHGALFTIDSGECIAGPCAGDALQPIPLIIDDDTVILDI